MSVETFKKKALKLCKTDPYFVKVIPPEKQEAFISDIMNWYLKNRRKLTMEQLKMFVKRYCKHQYKEVGRTGSGKTLCIERKCSICGDVEQVMPNLLEDFFSV